MDLIIHKFQLPVDPCEVALPMVKGARLLSVANDANGLASVWALFDRGTKAAITLPLVYRRIACAWTGSPTPPMPLDAPFLGTLVRPSGLVCHYFDLGEAE